MSQPIAREHEPEEDTQSGKYLTFSLGAEFYGIEIKYVTEIIGMQSITELPQTPAYVRGIINLRGKIIPVIDVRLRFGKPFQPYNDRTCIIVIDLKQTSIGLIVDAVSEVMSISEEEMVPPPEFKAGGNPFLQAIAKTGTSVKLLLDGGKLLTDHETEQLHELNITRGN